MTTIVSRWRARRLDEEEALSLVEMMIALMIMGIAVLALASVAAASLVQVRNSRARQQAVDAASASIEGLRLRDYAAIAMDANDPDVQALGGCAGAFDEPAVETSVGTPVPYETFVSGVVTVRMLVTWYDNGDDDACTDADHDRTVKRVTALASWTDAGGTRTIEQSTLVSDVERGLPAPDFRLGTPEVSLEWTSQQAADPDPNEICIGHVLRNIGAQDSYEWFLERLDNTGTPVKVSKGGNTAEFRSADGTWTVRGFFEYPAQPDPLDPADYDIPFGTSVVNPTGLPAEVQLMVDDDGDGDFSPRTQARVNAGEQARVWICYLPTPSKFSSDSSDARTFIVTVRSQFDPNQLEQATHGVTVSPENVLRLWLFDDDLSPIGSNNNRLVVTSGDGRALPTFAMGPLSPQGLQSETLGTTSFIPDNDRDVDPSDSAGVWLRDRSHTYTKSNGQSTTISLDSSRIWWHKQFAQATTLHTAATLRLYSTTDHMLNDGVGYPRQVTYAIKVQVLPKNENLGQAVDLASVTFTYEHQLSEEDQFVLKEIPLTFANPTLAKEQYLRLEIDCISSLSYRDGGATLVDVGDECVVGYDHTAVPSHLDVEVVE